jgi:competence protein ComEC
VYIHPLLYQKLTVENKVLDYIWNISCVSVAAQIATFPLSLYYFHQFPNYFLLSNLFIIPISTVAMYAGLAMLAVSWIPYVAVAAAWLLYWSVWLLNASVLVTEQLPMAITQGIQISALETLLIYLAIFLAFVFFYVKRMGYAVSVVICCIGIACIQIMEVWKRQQQRRIAVYYVPKQSVMCFTNAQQQHLVCADSLLHDETKKRFHLYADWYKQGINEVNFVSVPTPTNQKPAVVSKEFSHGAILSWQGKKMLLLNKKLRYGEKISIPANLDYLVLQNDAVFSLKAFAELPPSVQLIIDTSNKQYRSKKLHAEAKTLGLKCHNIWEAGAYVEDLSL